MLEVIAWILGAYLFSVAAVAVYLMFAGWPDSKLKIAAIWPYALFLALRDLWRAAR